VREKRYHPPGAPPGTLTAAAGSVVPKAVHVIHYSPDILLEADITSAEDLERFRHMPGVTWVNMDGLGNVDLLRELGKFFRLHVLALEDVLNVPQRPKLDDYGDRLFLVAHMLEFAAGELQTEQVSLFLGDSFVLTIQETPGDCLDPIRERLRKGVGQLRREGADFLAYAILDAIIDNYFPSLEGFGELIEEIEDEVAARPTPHTLVRVHDAKRQLINVRRCIWPLREVINELLQGESHLIKKPTQVYLRDCHQHTVYILDLLETYREVASSLVEVYNSSVSNRLNQVMKILTVIATIFMPLTFLAGIYGMNFNTEVSPWNMPELNWRWGYPAFWVVSLLIVVVMLILFRRKGWLGGADKG